MEPFARRMNKDVSACDPIKSSSSNLQTKHAGPGEVHKWTCACGKRDWKIQGPRIQEVGPCKPLHRDPHLEKHFQHLIVDLPAVMKCNT